MSFKFLENNGMDLLMPSSTENVVEPTFTITYSEEDARRICKQHLNNKFNLKLDESDFCVHLDISADMDGNEVRDFYFEIDVHVLSGEDVENLEDLGYISKGFFESTLKTVLYEEFEQPEFINIEAFLGVDEKLLIEVRMPLEHYDMLKNKSNQIKYLENPLSQDEMKDVADEDNYIEGIVAVSDEELFNNDFENFLDLISERLCGSICLMDVQYDMVGVIPEEHLILYSVSGDASNIIEQD